MKRSRVALLLFMATFAGSLLAAGMAGGEWGVAAHEFAGGSTGGGYCEFAYDPADEEPYDSCELNDREFAGQPASPLAGPQTPPWLGDDSLEYYDADSIYPAEPYAPPKVSASLNEPVYGLPAEDEISLDSNDDEVANPSLESESRVDAPSSPSAQMLYDPLTGSLYDYRYESYPCTQHCWPELYGDTDDPDADPYYVAPEIETANLVSELISDIGLAFDELLGKPLEASRSDFVRRIDAPSDVAAELTNPPIEWLSDDQATPDLDTIALWGRQVQAWVAKQDWLSQEVATINARAEFYVQGLTPPPAAPAIQIKVQWSKVDLVGRAERFLTGLLSVYGDAVLGLSNGVREVVALPGLFDKPVRQAHDPSVRTRTSSRTPWRIDL